MNVNEKVTAPVWVIELPLELPDRWFRLCQCRSIDAVASVICTLLPYKSGIGDVIRVRTEIEEVSSEM